MAQSAEMSTQPTRTCVYCGNNKVNHIYMYWAQTFSVLCTPTQRTQHFLWRKITTYLEDKMTRVLFFFFYFCGCVRFSTDMSRVVSGRSKVVWEEAHERGIPMEQIIFLGKPTEHFRAKINGRWEYFMSIPIPSVLNLKSRTWMDNKIQLKNFFALRGIRIPKGGRATSQTAAEQIFDGLEKPVIVKPEIGSRGRHTITHIYTIEELKKAFPIAQQLCKFVVIEEHFRGSVYRGTFVHGEIVGILRGDPPRIIGDGQSSIAELIVKKNETKHTRQSDFVLQGSAREFLYRQGYTLATVLPQGHRIDLTEKIGLSYGGRSSEDYELAHPKLLAQLTEAGNALNAPLIGFDFISEDISADPDTTRWGIIEANTLPFIDLHHDPLEGTPRNVAGKIWDLWKYDY